MYIYICICKTHIHRQIQTSIHPHIHTPIHAYTHTSIHPYTHPCIHTSIHPSIHPCMHACMHECMHIHTHTHTNSVYSYACPEIACAIENEGQREQERVRGERPLAIVTRKTVFLLKELVSLSYNTLGFL